ncbi:MAG: serine/threonine-protein kinase [Gemmatimonadaceae bacterium]
MPERFLGRTLGKYRVDELVGTGGFAWVYKAYDPELEIPVALKVLKPHYAGDEKIEQRFRREASTAARLRHPNIIKIYAVGVEDGAVYFAMDYLPTGLADRLEVMSTLPESLLVRVGIDVASALGYAHREGVIHRDVKVDNILFDDHGNAIVADFGIARAVQGHVGQTSTGMVVGTPQYFSPEQARALPLDGRADIYSLGVTLFRAATGKLPFEGEDWYDIARQHVEERPPKPRALNPALSRETERVILKCLAKSPDDRYPTGEALAEDLTAALELLGVSTTVKRASLPAAITTESPFIVPGVSRRRLVPLAAAGVALLGTVVALAVIRPWASATPVPTTSNGGAVATHPDSTVPRRDSSTATRSGARPAGRTGRDTARPRPALVVHTPDGATVTVDGRRITAGTWRSESLPGGNHRVRAFVNSVDGCPTADVTERVSVRGGTRTISLNPRGCGRVRLDTKQDGATYSIRSGGWSTGPLPIPDDQIVVVPFGRAQLTVKAPYCADFSGDVEVRPSDVEKPKYVRAHLVCGAG